YVQEQYSQTFPVAIETVTNAFAAPEIFKGLYDERSDVYSLGAILYLLLTRYAPVITLPKVERAEQHAASHRKQDELSRSRGRLASTCKELIPPHLFSRHIPLEVEQVVVRALSLNPVDRYASVDALVEALMSVDR